MREDVALSQAQDFVLVDELTESFDQTLITDLKIGSEAIGGAWRGGLTEQSEDLFAKRIARWGFHGIDGGCQFQVWPRFGVGQLQSQRLRGRRRAVFDREHQLAVMAAQIEKRIDPGIEIGAAS